MYITNHAANFVPTKGAVMLCGLEGKGIQQQVVGNLVYPHLGNLFALNSYIRIPSYTAHTVGHLIRVQLREPSCVWKDFAFGCLLTETGTAPAVMTSEI